LRTQSQLPVLFSGAAQLGFDVFLSFFFLKLLERTFPGLIEQRPTLSKSNVFSSKSPLSAAILMKKRLILIEQLKLGGHVRITKKRCRFFLICQIQIGQSPSSKSSIEPLLY
jgi:hypothetical protein